MSSDSDTWSKLQAHKRKQDNLRERLAKRRKERQGLVDDLNPEKQPIKQESESADDKASSVEPIKNVALEELEQMISSVLSDKKVVLPILSHQLKNDIEKKEHCNVNYEDIVTILGKLEAQNLISLKRSQGTLTIIDCESLKMQAVIGNDDQTSDVKKENKEITTQNLSSNDMKEKRKEVSEQKDDIASLLSMPTTKEVNNKKLGNEILDLLNQPTAKELSLYEKFKSKDGAMVKEFCAFGTRVDCRKNNLQPSKCRKLHFRKIIQGHTDEYLGDCSFLNTCFHMDTCKYVHYEVDDTGLSIIDERRNNDNNLKQTGLVNEKISLVPAQWIQCDVRYLDFDTLMKFSVIMADPPWDIHMELPYGTMSDNEMKGLPVAKLQDDGYIFLWVTGRAIELGRECLQIWGYRRCDELIWVKTNQLQRLIRTGRTGHWINHGKEHCLIGVKGTPDPTLFNKGLDCDVLVSEVRDTSHKPDEIYGLIERLAPGQRKVELFGRQHNVQPNWVTLGNQLSGVNLCEPDVVRRFKERYPSGSAMEEKPKPKSAPTVIDVTPQQGHVL